MDEKHDAAQADPLSVKLKSTLRRVAVTLLIALVIFLIGFVPMWYRARVRTQERDAAQRELRLSQMKNVLAAATIDARHGDYEPARKSAASFFTSLRAEIDRANDSALTPEQRSGLQPLFNQRDDLITLLARGDPASADRLSDLYVAYQKVFGQPAAAVAPR